MRTTRFSLRLLTALLAALVVTNLAGPVRAADAADDLLRKQALALNDVTGDDVIDSRIKDLLKNADDAKKLLAAAKKLASEKKEPPFNYNATFILARVADELKEVDTALGFYRLSADEALKLQSGKKLSQAFGGLIDLLYENKRFEETTKVCREFIEVKGNDTVDQLKPAVMERMVQSLTKQGQIKEALKLVENLVKAEDIDGGWYFLQLKGWVQREDNKPAEAAKTYEVVLGRIENDKGLKDEVRGKYAERARYLLSGIYIEANDVKKAIEHLETLVKAKPDDPTYNNDLGYIMADNDMKLDEAEKLIRKAIDDERKLRKANPKLKPEQDKDIAAYLDSLGWVLFKQKKFKEAKEHLEEAIKDKEGQHIEIFDHLGDVRMALGDKAGAVDAWKKGVESVKDNKREKDRREAVEKKIKAAE